MENDDVNNPESPPPARPAWIRVGIGVALVLSVLLIGAGYLIGSGLGGGKAATSAAPVAKQPGDPVQYVACMRQNGVSKFPEPGPGGRLRLTPQDGVDTKSQAFKNAEAACKSLMPAGAGQQGQPGPIAAGSMPASFVPMKIDAKEYVACMRKNGVPDFPEPVNGMFSYDARTAAAQAADKICRKYLPSDAPQPPE